jgi:hypothetical protein
MPITFLENDHRENFSPPQDAWLVACLCAAWCDVCTQYRSGFERLVELHPEMHFVWIDVEDRADLVGDIDVENFPTLLIQRGNIVAFYGPVLPDPHIADRLIRAQAEKTEAALQTEAQTSDERMRWQKECNLYRRLKDECPS